VRNRFRDVLVEAHHGGLDAAQIEELFHAELEKLPPSSNE
jgi:hypothetical protein